MRELESELDASALALDEAKKAVSLKSAECERATAKHEAAEAESESLRDALETPRLQSIEALDNATVPIAED